MHTFVSFTVQHLVVGRVRGRFGLTYEIVKEAGALLVGKDITIDIDAEAIGQQ